MAHPGFKTVSRQSVDKPGESARSCSVRCWPTVQNTLLPRTRYSAKLTAIRNPVAMSLTKASNQNLHATAPLRLVRRLIFAVAGCLLGAATALGNTTAVQNDANPVAPVVMVLGDSLSASYGLDPSEGWVTLLERWLQQRGKTTIVNISISGETTSGGLERLPAALSRWKPALVILALGGNDGLRGTPLNVIADNLQKMIILNRQHGAQTILAGMRIPPNYGPRYTQGFFEIYARLASQQKLPLVPFLLEGIATRPDLMQSDGLHPRSTAQQLILDNIKPVIAEVPF